MIRITPLISIGESELRVEFVRSSGPGGQNVNKVSTAAQLSFDAAGSPSLPHDVKNRLLALAGARATSDGRIVIDARRFRSQKQNRDDAVNRLVQLIRQAAHKPTPRRKTAPTAGAKRRRLDSKRRRGEIKKLRGPAPEQ